jgi:hypothetical protein
MQARRWIVILCVAAVLLAAMSPSTCGLLLAVFFPIWFVFAVVGSVLLGTLPERGFVRQVSFLPVFAPRPPPVG